MQRAARTVCPCLADVGLKQLNGNGALPRGMHGGQQVLGQRELGLVDHDYGDGHGAVEVRSQPARCREHEAQLVLCHGHVRLSVHPHVDAVLR